MTPDRPPTSPQDSFDLRATLRQFDIRPDKRLGQNFLADESALAKVTQAARLTRDDTALEVGPGVGSLTRWLAANAGRVVAVEIDPRLQPALEQTLRPYPNVRLVLGDILDLNPVDLVGTARPYKVVANIPYYITSALIRHLLEAKTRPESLVLTVQREVAQRICAAPGDLSLLAISVQYYGKPSIVAKIPAGAFHPRPEVDSSAVLIEVYEAPPVAVEDVNEFFRVVKAGFSQKRKTLRNALSGGLRLPAGEAESALQAAGIDPKRRAETVTLVEWARLADEVRRLGR